MDAEEKKFLEYQATTGGEEPLGLIVPFGYPPGVEDYGGVGFSCSASTASSSSSSSLMSCELSGWESLEPSR